MLFKSVIQIFVKCHALARDIGQSCMSPILLASPDHHQLCTDSSGGRGVTQLLIPLEKVLLLVYKEHCQEGF